MIDTTHQQISPVSAAELMAPSFVDRLQRRAVMTGVVLGIASVIGAFFDAEQFFRSYLVGFMGVLGLTLGGLGLLMLQYVTKGNWGFVLRRQFEAASRTLWLPALIFVPLAVWVGMGHMYPWAIPRHPSLSTDEFAKAKYQDWLNPHGYIARAVVYFLFWFVMITLLNRWGKWQDQRPEDAMTTSHRYQKLSGPGIIFWSFLVTFGATDWVGSLDPQWFSTIFGMIFMVGEAMIMLTFCILLTNQLAKYKPVSEIMQPTYWHDLGNLSLTLVMLFAYLSFSQFLITWSGNLPEEIEFYVRRTNGNWAPIALIIVLFHFAIPFFLLLHKPMKRNPHRLIWIAGMLFVSRYIDLTWYIMPSFHDNTAHTSMWWMGFTVPVAMLGIWIAVFCAELKKRPLYPIHDLLWPEITVHHHGY
jgi:hypothetical protein